DDFEVVTPLQIFITRITDIVAADEKSRDLPRDPVDSVAERFRHKVSAITEDAALAVVPRFDEANPLAAVQYAPEEFGKSVQIGLSNQGGAAIGVDQLFERGDAVAVQYWGDDDGCCIDVEAV